MVLYDGTLCRKLMVSMGNPLITSLFVVSIYGVTVSGMSIRSISINVIDLTTLSPIITFFLVGAKLSSVNALLTKSMFRVRRYNVSISFKRNIFGLNPALDKACKTFIADAL